MKSSTTIDIKRQMYLVLVLVWMVTVFIFSSQPSDTSQNTSLNTTKRIVEIFTGNRVSNEEKEQMIENFDPIVRKLAHFTLYTLGGVLIVNFINTYTITDKKKILYSISIGATYACTDEFHQLFVEGRSGQLTDILIDSLGVATGVCCFLCIIKIVEKIRLKCKAKI